MTLIELNRKQTTFRNKVLKVKKTINSFPPTDSTKGCIALKSKLDNIKSIITELDILQNDYCALLDKVNLKDSMDTLNDLKRRLKKPRQLESIEDEPRNLNSQAKFCEEHFVNNHRRGESGQYFAQMAFLKEPSCLGESKQMAIRRLNSLWRKLDANPNLKVTEHLRRKFFELT
ncbi:uncharacterized protein TNCT_604781 [Trichonephila clavata]|uniref:Uncharacterized protein n=1 Tax=Trichonephila clavata TaxID=2740835 RepID=A0A8X6GZA4_TRICU|nr:uncharacterized protein TNCT_604781 [Trichonephila clavata]